MFVWVYASFSACMCLFAYVHVHRCTLVHLHVCLLACILLRLHDTDAGCPLYVHVMRVRADASMLVSLRFAFERELVLHGLSPSLVVSLAPSGSIAGYPGADPGSTRGRPGGDVGRSGVDVGRLAPSWVDLGVDLGSTCVNLVSTWGRLVVDLWSTLVALGCRCGDAFWLILGWFGSIRCRCGVDLGSARSLDHWTNVAPSSSQIASVR